MKQRSPAEIWLRGWRTSPHAGSRLIVFPHAGGSASFYRTWCDALPTAIDLRVVQYPGREDRLNDPFAADLRSLASDIADALAPMDDLPLALFGHSLGAIVAYEAALRLETAHNLRLMHLFASGQRGPNRRPGGGVHQEDELGLLAELARVGGTSMEILEYPELCALVLSSVRDDYRLIETYLPGPALRLNCPITACVGDGDSEASAEEMGAWAEHTTNGFRLSLFPGDHFYLVPQQLELARQITGSLANPACPANFYPPVAHQRSIPQ